MYMQERRVSAGAGVMRKEIFWLVAAAVAFQLVFSQSSSPARAQTKAVAPLAQPKTMTFNTIQNALYQALNQEQSPDSVALLIKQNLDALSRTCEKVMAYQVFRYNSGARTLKIKCARQALIAMTVSTKNGVQAIGGDGSIGEMLPSDGRIYSVLGQTLQTYLAEQKVRDTTKAKARGTMPVAVPLQAAAAPRWSMTMMALSALLALVTAFLLMRFLSARRSSQDHGWGLSSMDKDYMVDESREVYPNVFRHPRGFFISRGKRGKRRLFNSALAAMLYRDLGLKIGEIGE
jgi:hypothetical protein